MTPSLIRPRQPGDLPSLVTALREVYEEDRYPSVWPEDAREFVQGGEPLGAWVAEVAGVPVGQVLLSARPGGTGLELKRLFVSPAARGLRLAEQLMLAAQAGAERLGRPVTLQVQEKNRAAMRLYGRLGWVQTGQGPAPWTEQDGSHPEFTWPSHPRGGGPA